MVQDKRLWRVLAYGEMRTALKMRFTSVAAIFPLVTLLAAGSIPAQTAQVYRLDGGSVRKTPLLQLIPLRSGPPSILCTPPRLKRMRAGARGYIRSLR